MLIRYRTLRININHSCLQNRDNINTNKTMNSSGDSNPESLNNEDFASHHQNGTRDFSGAPEDDIDIEDDEEDEDIDEAASSLPRPPTKPNVHIDDLTICPVCTQSGKHNTRLMLNREKLSIAH